MDFSSLIKQTLPDQPVRMSIPGNSVNEPSIECPHISKSVMNALWSKAPWDGRKGFQALAKDYPGV